MTNSSHRRPPKPVIALVVLALLAGLGYWWWSSQQATAAADALLSGTVESTEYQVASVIAGRITEVTVTEGDSVKAGEVIARLDDTALRLQVEQAEAGVRAANAQVDAAEDDGTKAEIAAAKARRDQARAAVRLAQVQHGYATVTAPHDGVVVALTVNAGVNAGPGKTLATLADPEDVFVRVYVPEHEIGTAVLGAEATVSRGADTYRGTVSFVSATAEFTPNAVETREQRGNLVYEVRVRISDGAGALKAGLPVDVQL